MCVRTLFGNENEPIVEESKQGGRTSRVKEKYVRLYEEMLEKDELERRRAQGESALNLPDLADGVLVVSTNHYSLILRKLSACYEVARRSKAFKFRESGFHGVTWAHVRSLCSRSE